MSSPQLSTKIPLSTSIGWLIATTLGIIVAPEVLSFVIVLLAYRPLSAIVAICVLPVSTGASIGAAQWIVLRRYFRGIEAWIPATAVGGAVGFALAVGVPQFTLDWLPPDQVGSFIESFVSSSLLTIVAVILALGMGAGLAIGIPQWLVLRRYIYHAGWWPVACCVAFAFSPALIIIPLLFSSLSDPESLQPSRAAVLYSLPWVGLLFPGIVTAAAITRLLSGRPPAGPLH